MSFMHELHKGHPTSFFSGSLAAPAAPAPTTPPGARRRIGASRAGRSSVVAALAAAAVRLRRPIRTLSRALHPRLLPLIDQLRHVAEHLEPGHRV